MAVMFLVDLVVEGMEQGNGVDWSVHLPLVLHMAILGLDHSRSLVSEHCKQLLLNLLVVLAEHGDHLTGQWKNPSLKFLPNPRKLGATSF